MRTHAPPTPLAAADADGAASPGANDPHVDVSAWDVSPSGDCSSALSGREGRDGASDETGEEAPDVPKVLEPPQPPSPPPAPATDPVPDVAPARVLFASPPP
eukprot:3417043-Prymnesium_polylepis.1